MTGKAFRIAGQFIFFALLSAFLVHFADRPLYRYIAEDRAVIKMSFSHKGEPVRPCRKLTQEELAELPPNMRKPTECPRERVPVRVVLGVDGNLLLDRAFEPSGLFGDGPALINDVFRVPTGAHTLSLGLRDSRREAGFDYERTLDVNLSPRQNLVVDFSAETGGFILR